ncbi:S8 family serine peptidase [Clostridium sp.]|uniref:S8 family serine peptidase n=1 Tax=Clostridium sp. TaxID=1506 RepID=UPI003FA540AD
MFNLKSKLDYNLNIALKHNAYQRYRVFIKCKKLFSSMVKKVSHFKGALIYPLESCNMIVANLNKYEIKSILEYPEIEKIFFDDYLFLCGMSVSSANNCYSLSKYSNNKYSGANIKIGLVDSGIFPHQDLLSPHNCIENFYDVVNGLEHPYDDNGHGTAMSGIICGSGINSDSMYRGIAPSSKIVCSKAFDALGKGYASDIIYSIENLVKISKEKNIRILCLPFELLNHNIYIIDAFNAVFDFANKNRVIPVLPSGSTNSNSNNIMGIATLKNCITVGGVDSKNSLSPYLYSSKGPYGKVNKPDFVTACVNITSLNTDKNFISEKDGIKLYPKKLDANYKTFSGTSLSVAFVSAVCALILEYNESFNFSDVLSVLKLACDPKDFPKANVGAGIFNFNKLLQ